MLEVQIHLKSADENKMVGKAIIFDDGIKSQMTDGHLGDYGIVVMGGPWYNAPRESGKVIDFKRKSNDLMYLLYLALKSIYGENNND